MRMHDANGADFTDGLQSRQPTGDRKIGQADVVAGDGQIALDNRLGGARG
jgi:hypothetical protein